MKIIGKVQFLFKKYFMHIKRETYLFVLRQRDKRTLILSNLNFKPISEFSKKFFLLLYWNIINSEKTVIWGDSLKDIFSFK